MAERARPASEVCATIDQCRVPFAMFIYGILACPHLAALWVYHLLLVGKGETTREHLASRRFPRADRHRPYTQGNFFLDWLSVLARAKPQTYMHFRKEYEQGDQRFGPRKGRNQAPLVPEAQNGGMEMTPVLGIIHGAPYLADNRRYCGITGPSRACSGLAATDFLRKAGKRPHH